MLSYSEIVTIIQESATYQTQNVVVRKLEIVFLENLLVKKPVKVITGIRRSGKSFILKRIYQKLSGEIPNRTYFLLTLRMTDSTAV